MRGSARDALLLALAALAPAALLGVALGALPAAPAGLALGGLVAPVVLLHLLRPRRPRRRVGSLLLWKEAERALEAQAPFRRLKRNLPLALALAALVLLAVAFARPVVRGAGAEGDLVIVVDLSARMRARDGDASGRTRLDAARAAAGELVASAARGARVLVVAATPRGARTALPWTDASDGAAVARALDALASAAGPTDLGDAALLAVAAGRARGPGATVHVFSDGATGELPSSLDVSVVRYHEVGEGAGNVGVVALEARPSRSGSEGAQDVLATLRSSDARPRAVYAELRRDGRALAARRVSLPPRGRAAVSIEARLDPGPYSLALVAAPGDPGAPGRLDALSEDDEAWLVVPAPDDATVALVASGSFPAVERALLSDPRAKVARRTPGEALDDARLRLVVACGTVPSPLPRVPMLCVAPPPGPVGPLAVGAAQEAPGSLAWDRGDRRFRFADLSDVEVARARPVGLSRGARALVESDKGALVAAFVERDLEHVVVSFDPAESSWPFRVSWPVFVRNVLLAALEDEGLGPRASVRAGSLVSLRAEPGTTEVRVLTPLGRTIRAPVDPATGRALLAETDEVGPYRATAGAREAVFAVSVLDERVTDLTPRKRLFPPTSRRSDPTRAREGERETVLPFLLAALALVLVEGFAYHRRW